MDDRGLRRAAELARDLVLDAGRRVHALQGRVRVRDKGRGLGPVTDADLASEELLLNGLERAEPGCAILSEESRQQVDRGIARLWCVDPLDGTREYAAGLGEYAVLVGLLADGRPAAGAIAVPSEGVVLWGWEGGGAFVGDRRIELPRLDDPGRAVAIHSRSHRGRDLARALQRLAPRSRVAAGSVGYKVAQILLGRAHLYVHTRRGTTWWDSVGPAAVLLAARGFVADGRGRPLRFEGGIWHDDGLLFTVPGLGPAAAARLAAAP